MYAILSRILVCWSVLVFRLYRIFHCFFFFLSSLFTLDGIAGVFLPTNTKKNEYSKTLLAYPASQYDWWNGIIILNNGRGLLLIKKTKKKITSSLLLSFRTFKRTCYLTLCIKSIIFKLCRICFTNKYHKAVLCTAIWKESGKIKTLNDHSHWSIQLLYTSKYGIIINTETLKHHIIIKIDTS